MKIIVAACTFNLSYVRYLPSSLSHFYTTHIHVQTKKHRLEELVAKLEEEDAVLSAKISSASQSQ